MHSTCASLEAHNQIATFRSDPGEREGAEGLRAVRSQSEGKIV